MTHESIDNHDRPVQRIVRLCRKAALSPYPYTPPEHPVDVPPKARPIPTPTGPPKTTALGTAVRDVPAATSIKWIVIPAILAAAANATFIYQILEPTSFLSAILGTEIRAIPRATWEEMYRELRSRLAADPIARKHDALSKLMSALDKAAPGPLPEDLKRDIPNLVRADADNLLCRMMGATLQDYEAAAAASPKDRFENIRNVVEANPQAMYSRLYNEEFTRAWHEILKKYIRRANVAASSAVSLNHYEIVDHYAALPKMQRRLSQLAADLRAHGHPTEADAVNRWLGQSLLGLIDSEKDSGTRLLCVELMRKSGSLDQKIAPDLAKLHDDYHAKASAAPIDPTHPYRPPVVDVQKYQEVWNPFIAATAFFLCSIGGFMALGLAVLVWVIKLSRGRQRTVAEVSEQLMAVRLTGIALASVALIALVCTKAMSNGPYSSNWAILISLAIVAWGEVTVALAVATGEFRLNRRRYFRLVLAALAISAIGLLLVAPPEVTVVMLRRAGIETEIGVLAIAGPILVLLPFFLLLRTPWRTLAHTASIVWMAAALSTLATLQRHRLRDQSWMFTTSYARMDELTGRLGDDWQVKYLQSARSAYHIPRP